MFFLSRVCSIVFLKKKKKKENVCDCYMKIHPKTIEKIKIFRFPLNLTVDT